VAWRAREPASVVAEIKGLVRYFGVGEVTFIDDDFVGLTGRGHQRAQEIAAALRQLESPLFWSLQCRPALVEEETFRLLQKAGLHAVFLGIEGIHPNATRLFRKPQKADHIRQVVALLRALELEVDAGFIPFHPHATLEEIEEGWLFLDELELLNPRTVHNRLLVYRGAPLRQNLLEEGRLFEEGEGESYSFADPRLEQLWVLLQIAVPPLAEYWIDQVRLERRHKIAWLQGDRQASDARKEASSLLNTINKSVRTLAFQAIDQIRQQGPFDLVHYARELREEALSRLDGFP